MVQFELDEAWLSSKEHMSNFNRISSGLGILKRLLGILKIDKNLPFVRISDKINAPLNYFSFGSVIINESGIHFFSRHKASTNNLKYYNLIDDLNFKIGFNEIESFFLIENSKSKIKAMNFQWLQINLINNECYLLCAAMKTENINEGIFKTNEMFDFLKNNVV